MYDRILVPLKGDRTDEAVVAHTGSLAKMSGGVVFLLRVLHTHSRDEAAFFEEQAHIPPGQKNAPVKTIRQLVAFLLDLP